MENVLRADGDSEADRAPGSQPQREGVPFKHVDASGSDKCLQPASTGLLNIGRHVSLALHPYATGGICLSIQRLAHAATSPDGGLWPPPQYKPTLGLFQMERKGPDPQLWCKPELTLKGCLRSAERHSCTAREERAARSWAEGIFPRVDALVYVKATSLHSAWMTF